MGFKENLKAKIDLDRLFRKILYTIKEPPETKWVDKELAREILDMTDFKHEEERKLDFYIRPLKDEVMEVLVLDNELPIYHTTVEDVALRKSPHWQEMFSIRNVKRIMNDQDVIVSKGKESLGRVYAVALAKLDLAYTLDDLEQLIEDARRGMEHGSAEEIRDSLELFFELIGFQPVYFEILEPDLEFFGRPVPESGAAPSFEHLIIFNEGTLSVALRKGGFSPKNDSDLGWVTRYAQGLEAADFRDIAVFEFLAELAMEQKHSSLTESRDAGQAAARDSALTRGEKSIAQSAWSIAKDRESCT